MNSDSRRKHLEDTCISHLLSFSTPSVLRCESKRNHVCITPTVLLTTIVCSKFRNDRC